MLTTIVYSQPFRNYSLHFEDLSQYDSFVAFYKGDFASQDANVLASILFGENVIQVTGTNVSQITKPTLNTGPSLYFELPVISLLDGISDGLTDEDVGNTIQTAVVSNNASAAIVVLGSTGEILAISEVASAGLITEFPDGFTLANLLTTDILLGICNVNDIPTIIRYDVLNTQIILSTLTGAPGFNYAIIYMTDPSVPANMSISGIDSPSTLSGFVFYNSDDGIHGQELWITDGSVAGTHMVKDINTTGSSATSNSYPSEFTPMNNKLYFVAASGNENSELWVSDGTELGTTMVKAINPGSGNANIGGMVNINNMLYFRATNGTDGVELWKSDGTESGTTMIKDINQIIPVQFNGSYPLGFTLFNGLIYFSADDGIHGGELWVTDGTEAGTNMIKNINNTGDGSEGGVLGTPFLVKGDVFYFYADDGIHGLELWVSDGTRDGTQLAYDLNPGPDPSNEYGGWGKIAGDNLYLSATDGVIGYELFIFENIPTTVPTTSLSLKVFLEGPYNSGSMSTNLAANIPLNQPFNNASGNYYGDESISSTFAATHNIVDWVVVELRSGTSAATATTINARKAVLVNSNGDLVDLDGSLDIDFKWVEAGDYYVTVYHRNHLAIMSSTAVTLTNL